MPTSSDQTRNLILRCREGDAQARNELFELVQGRLKAIVRSSLRGSFGPLRDGMDSDDGLQELCIRLLERWDRIVSPVLDDAESDPVPIFFGQAAQAIRDIFIEAIRRKYGRGKQPRPLTIAIQAQGPSDSNAGDHDLAESTNQPDRLAAWTEVHEFVSLMPMPLKQVADLRWYGDFSHAEVGRALGMAEVTARMHWSKIRHQLRERFSDLPFDWSS